MLTVNELATLFTTVCTVRMVIDAPANAAVLHAALDTLDAPAALSAAEDRLRPRIAAIEGLDRSFWGFADGRPEGLIDPACALMLTEPIVLNLLRKLCQETLRLLEAADYRRAWSLADAWHNLPKMLMQCGGCVPPAFWSAYLRPYREAWDHAFLQDEEALIKAAMEGRRVPGWWR